jgi:hypothetical protein
MLAALILAAALPAQAQDGASDSSATTAPLPDADPIAAEETPPTPAPAPPAPAELPSSPRAAPAQPAEHSLALPAGIQALPEGGWRVRFTAKSQTVDDPAVQVGLAEIGRRLAGRAEGRVSLLAQASGPRVDVSAARRTSLARSLAVKQALAAGGLAETRIDVRPLGRTADALDAVDILPPEAQAAQPAR